MIQESYYLSDVHNIQLVMELTELSEDEIELIVGRFKSHSSRAGQLRGELIVMIDGDVKIRHHFTKKILWETHS